MSYALEKRTAEVVLPAVRKSIDALPAARIVSDTPITRADGLVGSEIRFTFEPATRAGLRYERWQASLVGQKRVLHVIHTGREGALERTAGDFRAAFDSIKEEN